MKKREGVRPSRKTARRKEKHEAAMIARAERKAAAKWRRENP